MAKNTNTFEKRRKEMERMQKAQKKRERRLARKQGNLDEENLATPPPPVDGETEEKDTQTQDES